MCARDRRQVLYSDQTAVDCTFYIFSELNNTTKINEEILYKNW